MGLLNDMVKTKQMKQEVKTSTQSAFTMEELQNINFGKYGENLKQNNILPQHFSKNPVNVYIDEVEDLPSIELVFKSKTNNDSWTLVIYNNVVSYSKNEGKTLKISSRMTKAWESFVKDVRWALDNDINSHYTKISIIK